MFLINTKFERNIEIISRHFIWTFKYPNSRCKVLRLAPRYQSLQNRANLLRFWEVENCFRCCEDYQWPNSRAQSAKRRTGSSYLETNAHGHSYVNKSMKTGFDND